MPLKHIVRISFAFAALIILNMTPSQAQVCNFSNTGINFGSLSLVSTSSSQATGTVTANCTGTPNATITICPNIGSGTGGNNANASSRYMTQGTETVPYNLYVNNGVGQVWGSYVWPYTPRPPAMSVTLSGNGTGTTQRTLFSRLSGANVSPGLYTSVFSGGHTLFDYGYAPGFTCGATTSSRAVRVPFTVQVNNISECRVTTTALDFGALNDLNALVDATNTITVNCSKGVRYTVGLNNGSSGSTNPAARRMRSATTTDSVTYGIYTNANRTSVWTANSVSDNSNGSQRTYTGYGRIPVQVTPASGAYSDTIVVTVTY